MLTTSRQVFALLQLATMQLTGDKAPAMAVDTVREVLAAHADTAVVTALKFPIVEIAPVLHAFLLLVQAEKEWQVIPSFIPKPIYPENRDCPDRLRRNG